MIELLVVIGIIVALVGAIFTISNAVFSGAKEKETKAMMLVVQEAIDEFQRNAPLSKVGSYATYYNNYPPDTLTVFTSTGFEIPTGTKAVANIAPGGVKLAGDPSPIPPTINNQGLKAMILAIRLYSPTASSILDRIDGRYFQTDKMADSFVRPVAPPEYLDRDSDTLFGPGDRPLEVIVDAFGQPLDYFATRLNAVDRNNGGYSPQYDREKFSTDAVSFNNNQPVLMSYGADGLDQFSNAVISSEFAGDPRQATIWYDYMADTTPNVVDNKYNQDNLFTSESVQKRLLESKP